MNPCIEAEDGKKEANEEIMDLDTLILERLRDYYRRNHDKEAKDKKHNGIPDQLIVHRDGVSESQFTMCGVREYNRIQKALSDFFVEKEVGYNDLPPVTLICAIKRHHTRIFPEPGKPDPGLVLNEPNKSKPGIVNNNPLPGTLVKERITYGEGNDFFLIGRKAIQGTAIPVHYNVLKNLCGYNLQDIAKLVSISPSHVCSKQLTIVNQTYDLCFLFGRSRTSVGLCTPVYYADLATARARCYVRHYYSPPKDPNHKFKHFDDSTETEAFEECLKVHPKIEGKMFYI